MNIYLKCIRDSKLCAMNTRTNSIIILLIIYIFIGTPNVRAQEESLVNKKEAPSFKLTRAEENYSYLSNPENSPFQSSVFDAIKYIPITQGGSAYLSFGGQIRPRFEHYSNRFWLSELDQNFYSQRYAFHSNVVLGKHFRLFGELYHGYTSHESEFAEYDKVDLFQAFAEIKLPINEHSKLSFRFGRQEMGLGAARLVGIREGPNIRRSFDMVRSTYSHDQTKIQAFYGKEVLPFFEAFDNDFTFFNGSASNPILWGVYSQFPIKGFNGINELYYLGFKADNSRLNDVDANEARQTIGLRRFGKIGKHWKYNTEIIYQFGNIGDNTISAFSIDTDWHYELLGTKWNWNPGLKLEYQSGDGKKGDGKINSFNPMFVNPAYYSLAATITPINIFGVHPSLSFEPINDVIIYIEWAVFWRASKNDGLYRPTRFINRPTDGSQSRFIGHQFGGKLKYEINRNLSFDLDISYFIAGDFLNESGDSENILHLAPTLNFIF